MFTLDLVPADDGACKPCQEGDSTSLIVTVILGLCGLAAFYVKHSMDEAGKRQQQAIKLSCQHSGSLFARILTQVVVQALNFCMHVSCFLHSADATTQQCYRRLGV